MNTTPLIFVLYDSVINSVFESQVLQLLQKKIKDNPYRPVHLVSFEKNKNNRIPTIKNMRITYFKRIPFIGALTIAYATRQLRSFLHYFPQYSLIARGPIAGLIAQHALNTSACTEYIVQARGLLADEYAYTHIQKTSGLMRLVHSIRTAQLRALEKKAYTHTIHIDKKIEVVSKALKDRLVAVYNADTNSITITTDDIPHAIDTQQKTVWRIATRTRFAIPDDWKVYCYNGSVKPWQKPEMIITFFLQQFDKNPRSFLLVITTGVVPFRKLIGTSIPHSNYTVLSTRHSDIYHYLSAADYGLLFRDDHVMNWVSRPTKALEYQAVGLEIIHNNTVEYLMRK